MTFPFGSRQPCDEALARSGPSQPCAEAAKPWVLATAILGSSLAFLEGSVVNVALPEIQAALSADAADVQWVMNTYLLFLGALMLSAGAAGDRFGLRNTFVTGVSVFAAGAVACGMAADTGALIAARAVQGTGAAILVPCSLALISRWFPPSERGQAIGTWAAFSALTTAFGPTLGGLVVDALSWRWAFLIVVPFAVAAALIALWRVPRDTGAARHASLDAPGALLATAGLGLVSFGLIRAGETGATDAGALVGLAGGVFCLLLFCWWESRAREPVMPLRLFGSLAFAGANAMTLLLYFALSGVLFFLPFNLVQVQGYSMTAAGAALLPFTLALALLSRTAGRLAERLDARWFLGGGPLIAALGIALLGVPGVDAGAYWRTFFAPLLLLGLGMAVAVAPLTMVVMSAVADEDAGKASGINNTAARVAGLLAVGLLGAVAVGRFSAELALRLRDSGLGTEAVRVLLARSTELAALSAPADWPVAPRRAVEAAVAGGFVEAFRVVVWVCAACAMASGVVGAAAVRQGATAGR